MLFHVRDIWIYIKYSQNSESSGKLVGIDSVLRMERRRWPIKHIVTVSITLIFKRTRSLPNRLTVDNWPVAWQGWWGWCLLPTLQWLQSSLPCPWHSSSSPSLPLSFTTAAAHSGWKGQGGRCQSISRQRLSGIIFHLPQHCWVGSSSLSLLLPHCSAFWLEGVGRKGQEWLKEERRQRGEKEEELPWCCCNKQKSHCCCLKLPLHLPAFHFQPEHAAVVKAREGRGDASFLRSLSHSQCLLPNGSSPKIFNLWSWLIVKSMGGQVYCHCNW